MPNTDHEDPSQNLDKLRVSYESGVLGKQDYSREIWKIHRRLFDYPSFLRSSNVETIEINEEDLPFRTAAYQRGGRRSRLLMWPGLMTALGSLAAIPCCRIMAITRIMQSS